MAIGKKNWIIPDCELPMPGEGVLKIKVTLYFTDAPCYDKIEWTVKAKSVRCFRMNNVNDMSGYVVPFDTQYAMKVESDGNIVLQYGRLDNRQTNLAYYTTLGFSE